MDKFGQMRWNSVIDMHWWVKGHYAIVKGLIKQYAASVGLANALSLDIGCSGGHVTEFLRQYGPAYGFDISFDGLLCSANRSGLLQADAMAIPFKDDTFDIVTLFDVAEHVEDDLALFREVRRVLKKAGVMFINVPAHDFLWGAHDEWNNHKRRYSKKYFIDLVNKSGFKPVKLTYLHPHLLLPMAAVRFMDRFRKNEGPAKDGFISLGPFLDNILFQTLVIESNVIKKLCFPFGISIFGILEKQDE